MKPSVGRVVHYVATSAPGTVCRAAIITDLTDCDAHMDCLGLSVFHPVGVLYRQHVAYDGTSQQYEDTWHWPERVD